MQKCQRYSTIPPLEYYSNLVTPSPLKKKEERTTRIQSPEATDRRTDGQTRRDAALPTCAAQPRHADRHGKTMTPGQSAADPDADVAAALGVARLARP